MTVYEPIELMCTGARLYARGPEMVQSPGTNIFTGFRTMDVKVFDLGPSDPEDPESQHTAAYLNIQLSWMGNASEDLPLPACFAYDGGDPNIYYKVTVQAIDSTEVE